MIFQQLAIPTTIELVCPLSVANDWELEKNYFNSNALFASYFGKLSTSAQCLSSEHIVTILNVIVLTGGFLHDC